MVCKVYPLKFQVSTENRHSETDAVCWKFCIPYKARSIFWFTMSSISYCPTWGTLLFWEYTPLEWTEIGWSWLIYMSLMVHNTVYFYNSVMPELFPGAYKLSLALDVACCLVRTLVLYTYLHLFPAWCPCWYQVCPTQSLSKRLMASCCSLENISDVVPCMGSLWC